MKLLLGMSENLRCKKNHDFLIDIFADLLTRQANAKLVLVGTGELIDTIKRKVSQIGIEESVIFLGTRNDVNELMQVFDIFLLPSLYEGLPVVGIEAQASGLPCVVSSTVSPEGKLSENVKLVPLEAPASYWCDTIEELYNRRIERKWF